VNVGVAVWVWACAIAGVGVNCSVEGPQAVTNKAIKAI